MMEQSVTPLDWEVHSHLILRARKRKFCLLVCATISTPVPDVTLCGSESSEE